MRRTKTLISEKLHGSNGSRHRAAVFVAIFIFLGTLAGLLIHAATTNVAVEPEKGALASGAQTVTNNQASGSQYVQFKSQASTPPGDPPPTTPPGCTVNSNGRPDSFPNTCNTVDADPTWKPDKGTNSGVLANIARTTVSSDVTLTTNGQTYENKDVTGCITVDANNVTLRNVRITGSCYDVIKVKYYDGVAFSGQHNGLILDHVEVSGTLPCDRAANLFNVTVTYSRISGCADAINVWDNAYFYRSVLGPPQHSTPGEHNDAIQLFNGFNDPANGNMAFVENVVHGPPGQTGSFIIGDENNTYLGNFQVWRNWIQGGNVTLRFGQSKAGKCTEISGNRFKRSTQDWINWLGTSPGACTRITNNWDDDNNVALSF